MRGLLLADSLACTRISAKDCSRFFCGKVEEMKKALVSSIGEIGDEGGEIEKELDDEFPDDDSFGFKLGAGPS